MARPLSFQQVEAFRAVVISGTTVAAARMLHTTQPTVSRLIGQAQSATGLKLFVRDRGRLQLTREGRHLFDTVQLNFQGFERIEQTVAALRTSGAGVFRIACTPSLAQSVLPAAMELFTKALPQVHFNVSTLGSAQIENGLRQGMYDIALTNNQFEGNEFQNHELHRSEAVWIGKVDHELASREIVKVTDLAGHALIGLPQGDRLEEEIRRAFADRNLAPAKTIETTYTSTICSFAAQGLGMAIINPYMASVFKDRLCIRRFSPKIGVTVYAVLARYSPISELSERFLQELRRFLGRSEWTATQLGASLSARKPVRASRR